MLTNIPELLSTQHNATALLIFAPIAILWGAFLFWMAVTDRGKWFSAWYESNRDSKMGFWAVSRDAKQFRAWHAALGVAFVVGGILILMVVA